MNAISVATATGNRFVSQQSKAKLLTSVMKQQRESAMVARHVRPLVVADDGSVDRKVKKV